MGRLTISEMEDLQKKGLLDDKAVAEMQKSGLVGTRRRGVRRYMKDGKGNQVTPQLYFRGLSKTGEYSKKMNEFKDEFTKLVNKYTTEGKNK